MIALLIVRINLSKWHMCSFDAHHSKKYIYSITSRRDCCSNSNCDKSLSAASPGFKSYTVYTVITVLRWVVVDQLWCPQGVFYQHARTDQMYLSAKRWNPTENNNFASCEKCLEYLGYLIYNWGLRSKFGILQLQLIFFVVSGEQEHKQPEL